LVRAFDAMQTPNTTSLKFAPGALAWCAVAFAAILVLVLAPMRGAASDDSKHPGSIESGGRTRTYYVHTPPGYDGSEKIPLVMVLHGGGGNAESAEKMSGMSDKADAVNFLVVYPDGTGGVGDHFHTWNSGVCCGYAEKNNVDDVAFLRALLDKLEYEYAVDQKRVYVTGISNGGMMAYRVACTMSDRIAAIAPVAGALDPGCNPSAPVSVIAFHGTEDENVPYNGGVGKKQIDGPRDYKSVAFAIDFWVKRDGCNPAPKKSVEGTLHGETYSGCKNGTAVVLDTVEGQGHAWPGGDRIIKLLDKPDPTVKATDLMWFFFQTHPKQ
jgi:polyhydroxybutyrate depolymerase